MIQKINVLIKQYLRVSSSISEAAIKRSILRLYDEQKPPDEKDSYAKVILPELALTFIGGCEEQLLTEKLKTSLTDFTSGVGKMAFWLLFLLMSLQ